jgi:hypothetical protein
MNGQSANVHRDAGRKRIYERRFKPQPAVVMGCSGNINRDPVFPGDHLCTTGMIGMFMGDEDSFDLSHGQPEAFHPVFCFSAGDTCIDQHGFMLIANIIAIAVASGGERGDIEGHSDCKGKEKS